MRRPGLDMLEQDLSCPRCAYCLRAQQGPVVRCPECGLECDAARMIAGRWRGPWYRVPRFSALLTPVAWAFAGGLALTFVADPGVPLPPATPWALTGLLVVGWVALLLRAHHQLGNGLGIPMALLAHMLLAGYLAGIAGVTVLAVRAYLAPTWTGTVVYVLLAAASAGLLVLCRQGEKLIARQCIREHLIRAAAASGPKRD